MGIIVNQAQYNNTAVRCTASIGFNLYLITLNFCVAWMISYHQMQPWEDFNTKPLDNRTKENKLCITFSKKDDEHITVNVMSLLIASIIFVFMEP